MKAWRQFFLLAGIVGCVLGGASCGTNPPPQPTSSRTAFSPTASSSVPTAQPLPDDSVPAIAQREVIRRQEQIRNMDDAALRASQAMAEDDLEGAVDGYRKAVDGL